jgi:hypothetical protein
MRLAERASEVGDDTVRISKEPTLKRRRIDSDLTRGKVAQMAQPTNRVFLSG